MNNVARAQVDNDLYQHCSKQWVHIRRALLNVRLPTSADWDDIRSLAISRVFLQLDKLDPTKHKGPWVKTVMSRAAYNALREYLPVRGRSASSQRQRLKLIWMRALITRVEEVSIHGEEEVVVIPDAIDLKADIKPVQTDFESTLPPRDQVLLRHLISGLSIRQISRKRVWSKGYQRTYRRVMRLRARYLEYLKQ